MIFQAITTKYYGPANVKGSRIKATAQAGTVWLEYDDGLSSEQNHNAAAKALADRYGWSGGWIGGGLSTGGNCYVNVEAGEAFSIAKREG
ncbi:MAG: hypothetical protein EOR11_19860 [Mesorhizobium sp.]|uniref:hypothetical protein n=1 Tax=Mesorhizobium sp. TaxID=1871066 RepID=UPI000FE4B32F|nr:hypothetical protein [Mesorhizobium sp.]RWP84718.1 MAG: hypothetical protein EOR11_19860 [Mesorhizobium sp.]